MFCGGTVTDSRDSTVRTVRSVGGAGTDLPPACHDIRMTDRGDQKRAVKAGYDAIAERYDTQRSQDPSDDEALRAFAADLAADGRLLDVGCGAGRGPLERFADRDCVGLDFSASQLALAGERVNSPLVQGDMTDLPFADDSFDAATAFYSVIHLPIDQHREFYREIRRVLRPGGQFLFSIGDDWAGENDDWLESGARMAWSFPSLDDTVSTLEDVGFGRVERYAVWSEMDQQDWPFIRCRVEK